MSGDPSTRSSELRAGSVGSSQNLFGERGEGGVSQSRVSGLEDLGLKGLASYQGRSPPGVRPPFGDLLTQEVGVMGPGVPGLGVTELGGPQT